MKQADFTDFMSQRELAETSYVRGDGAKVDAIVPHSGNASLHTLAGETLAGAATVAAYYREHAKDFDSAGVSRFEVIHTDCSGDLGFWTGFQIATVRFRNAGSNVEMRLRVTEIFRKEDGTWKLIHRHADRPPHPSSETRSTTR